MQYPAFYDDIPRLTVYDPLAGFLGSTLGGIIDYSYVDVVKLTGHSCPTVASAYWMTYLAIRCLYGSELPCRGGLRVEFSEPRTEGVTGVMANVVQMLTGAAGDDGFKGLSGIFFRNGLMNFGVGGTRKIRYQLRDNLRHVDVSVDMSRIPISRDLKSLMQKCLHSEANPSELALFGDLWQERVKNLILEYGEDRDVFRIIVGR